MSGDTWCWQLQLRSVTEPLTEYDHRLSGVPVLVAYWGDGRLMLIFKKADVGSSAGGH